MYNSKKKMVRISLSKVSILCGFDTVKSTPLVHVFIYLVLFRTACRIINFC